MTPTARAFRGGHDTLRLCLIGLFASVTGCHSAWALDPVVLFRHKGNVIQADQVFSVSPNGRWMLFMTGTDPTGGVQFTLFDITGRKIVEILPPDAKVPEPPLFDAGTWSTDSSTVFVHRSVDAAFEAQVTASTPRWRLVDSKAAPQPTAIPTPPLVFKRVSDREVDVIDARDPARVLAQHRTSWPWRTRLDVTFPEASPDGRWASYIVSDHTGSFEGSSTAYLVSMADTSSAPVVLVGDAFGPVHFDRSGTHAFGMRRAADVIEILTWRLSQ